MTAPLLLDLSRELSDLPDLEAYLGAASAMLRTLWPADHVFWMDSDFGVPHTTVLGSRRRAEDLRISRLMAQARRHPVIDSYLARPADLTPRRLSDVDPRNRSAAVYPELSAAVGPRQLSLIVGLEAPAGGRGWIFGRTGPDFPDRVVEAAAYALPLLTALDHLYHRLPPAAGDGAAVDEARTRAGLTVRELDVLELLSRGLTAQNIARVRRISVRTVHKHLENVYAKLDCHDRLVAVSKARRLGLLPSSA